MNGAAAAGSAQAAESSSTVEVETTIGRGVGTFTWRESLAIGCRKGVDGMRTNRGAGVVLWCLAGLTGILYYNVPAVTSALEALGAIKLRLSYVFTFLSIGTSGGFLPSVATVARRVWAPPPAAGEGEAAAPPRRGKEFEGEEDEEEEEAAWIVIGYNTLLFAVYGCWIDLFSQGQALVFGDGVDPATIAAKVRAATADEHDRAEQQADRSLTNHPRATHHCASPSHAWPS